MASLADVCYRVLGAGALAFVAACASTPVPRKAQLAFLDQSSVTAEQVREYLGDAQATFEQGRVLSYRLRHEVSGYYIARNEGGWSGVTHDLIVVLDEHNVVQKHKIVAIRAP
jgi:hypothetical protein